MDNKGNNNSDDSMNEIKEDESEINDAEKELKEDEREINNAEKEIKSKVEQSGFVIKKIYREVFFPGFDKLYYRLTSSDSGFKILELLTDLIPSQCSDYYFMCEVKI